MATQVGVGLVDAILIAIAMVAAVTWYVLQGWRNDEKGARAAEADLLRLATAASTPPDELVDLATRPLPGTKARWHPHMTMLLRLANNPSFPERSRAELDQKIELDRQTILVRGGRNQLPPQLLPPE